MNSLNKLLQQQNALAEEIFTHKSDINNIQLQLDRSEDDDSKSKEWHAKARYALSMKKAELEKLELMLENTKLAVNASGSEGTPDDAAIAIEFMHAAKRRLNSEVYDSLCEEADEVRQDSLYNSVAPMTHAG